MAKRDKQIIGGKSYPPPTGIRTKPAHGPRKRNHVGTGREKGLVPTPFMKTIAKRGRSYKWKEYSIWNIKYNGTKKRGKI